MARVGPRPRHGAAPWQLGFLDALVKQHRGAVKNLHRTGARSAWQWRLALGDRTFIDLAHRLLGDMALIAPGKTLTVVGFSFGSLVAEAMALSAPDQIGHLVLIRGRFDGKIPSFPAGMKSWKNLAQDEAREVHRHNLGVSMISDPERIDDEAIDLHASNLLLATVRPNDFSNAGMERALEDIAVPLTAIRGEFDALGGDAQLQRTALTARRPGSELHIIKGAGHWVAYEQPETINSILNSLQQHTAHV
jgi:2-hydroxy-6-oxonona-2,4-dienedioate hydrolase